MSPIALAETTPTAKPSIVTVLGDSRVFDTYYTNDRYLERYGYDSTFPFLLRRDALADGRYDIVHIPDHFRGGTVENNIIRVALTDPSVVVLCDGIWETLVSRALFDEWLTRRRGAGDKDADANYSTRRLVDLFVANELSVSPADFQVKQRRLISYFRRRRRQCVWMSLPIPPKSHFDRLHFAGNYQCLDEWDECLDAINCVMRPTVELYKANWFDLDMLMDKVGGADRALIDQWHFSKLFHAAIADALKDRMPALLGATPPLASHISHDHLLANGLGAKPVILAGRRESMEAWISCNRATRIEGTIGLSGTSFCRSEAQAVVARAVIIVLVDGPDTPSEFEAALLDIFPRDTMMLYPTELGSIENPATGDRRQHGTLR